ncbi:NADPH-dependent FMN reductase [Acinetobacter courvalinii]|uniref:NADPH-dependent FMN reductase n=1 Tax=Acinetobacter courvalinii TaxID=280147 RepID=UPI000519BE99|nr:NADPH-dependent FMN reductase [Acinetobacter courvalinii]
MKILAISGSARERSTNTAFLKTIKKLSPLHIEITVFNQLSLLPIFSPDNEEEMTPEAVKEFIHAISVADGIIISSPEYIRSIPGGLKNAIDWMVSRIEIIDKPIVLAHASSRGDDMLISLRKVLSTLSGNFFEHLFLRISLLGKSPEEINELQCSTEHQILIVSFLNDFAREIYQSQLREND